MATGLHLIETALHHGAVCLYLVAVKLVLFAYFTTNSKGEKNTPKTHKALYLRAFCGCGGGQGRDVKISTVALDRLAGSRKVIAIELCLVVPVGSLLLIEDPRERGKVQTF